MHIIRRAFVLLQRKWSSQLVYFFIQHNSRKEKEKKTHTHKKTHIIRIVLFVFRILFVFAKKGWAINVQFINRTMLFCFHLGIY